MASSSSSFVEKSFKYDVFLSFRGEDTRKTFVDHLYLALVSKGITTYKDDETIEKGERIDDQLIRSIEESRFYIVVFSKNYADSSWCLDELVKIMECQKTKEQTAYPVFYDVEPTEVRNQSGAVGEAFAKHVQNPAAGKWRDALKEASGLAGWELKKTLDGCEAKFIQKIVIDISLKKCNFINLSIDEKLVGMKTRVTNVISSLEIDSEYDVRMIGIWGMGGAGKTTLARAVFDHISTFFDGKSFVENELQKQVLKDVLNDRSIDVTGVSDGKNKMENMMPDDEAICLFNRHAFRSKFPIQGHEQKLSRKVVHYAAGLPLTIKVLGSLLCGRTEPIWLDTLKRLKTIPLEETLKKLEISYDSLEEDQKEIFLDVACILKGEPVEEAITILESCGFHAQIGLEVLEQKSLINISYNGYLGMHDHIEEMGKNIVRRLHPNEPNRHSRLWVEEEIKEILVNDLGTKATRSMILKHMDINPAVVMKSLRKMKKIRLLYASYEYWKIDKGDVQYLPDTLRSICWDGYPFSCLPKTFQANDLIYLKMLGSCISQIWEIGERKVLKKLKFINLSYSNLRTFDLGMTPNIENICLKGCKDLVELQIPVPHPMLKDLDLSGSKVSNLNLGLTPNLKVLELEGCYYLHEIHAPVGCLKNLTHLNLSGCLRFEYFSFDTPDFSHRMNSLATLKLNAKSLDRCSLHPKSNLPKFKFQCKYSEVLPSWSGNVEKLLSFGLCACTNLESFSASICGLKHLTALTLKGSIPELPKDLWKLESLEQLTLCMQEIKHLPDGICMLKHLKSLYLEFCGLLEQLPMDLGGLECLEKLALSFCRSLRDIPDSICQLKCLKELDLPFCRLVEKLPQELGRLECLERLDIAGAGISRLPESIIQLKHLKSLDLTCCEFLEQLPMDLGGLECLEKLDLSFCRSLRDIPDSICQLKCLKELDLSFCHLVEKLPDEFGRLECLKLLNIKYSGISRLPESIFQLKALRIIRSWI
ncbi:hypothetical protein R6Q57_006044 [Mikania cordata]